MKKKYDLSTRCVHAGEGKNAEGAPHTPIYNTIEVAGSGEDATKLVDNLELFLIAPSLGGAESLVTQPMTTTHHGLSPEERSQRGITDSMIRLSIGMEAKEDLIEDLIGALKNL